MKKISVKDLDMLGMEKMSRENLKNVFGGQSQGCPPNMFECSDGSCIFLFQLRDGVKDCPHGEDEW